MIELGTSSQVERYYECIANLSRSIKAIGLDAGIQKYPFESGSVGEAKSLNHDLRLWNLRVTEKD